MKKQLLRFSMFLAAAAFSVDASAQCLDAAFGQYPFAEYTPSYCDGLYDNTIVDNGYAGEYSLVNVTEGETYTFLSNVDTDFITIGNEEGSESLASGTTPVTWVATYSGLVSFYTHLDADCGDEDTNRLRVVRCGVPAECTGAVVDLPYEMGFEESDPLSCLTFENVNGNTSWSFFRTPADDETEIITSFGSVRYVYNADLPADDWMFTPGFNLEGGMDYTLTFNYRASDGPDFIENLGVSFGTAAESAAMTETLGTIENIDTNLEDAFETFTVTFSPETTGVYYIGLHATSEADQGYLYVDDISVTGSLSTGDQTADAFKFGPNPVKNQLSLSYDRNISDVTVYNLLGQQVLSSKVNATQGNIDMTSLPTGSYIAKVSADGAVKTIKLTKS